MGVEGTGGGANTPLADFSSFKTRLPFVYSELRFNVTRSVVEKYREWSQIANLNGYMFS